ncbi:MAG: hypothetical protein IRY83_17705 [Chloroflexi bacterium]|nr:hypothetical protein [Chloroflexota bacterium]
MAGLDVDVAERLRREVDRFMRRAALAALMAATLLLAACGGAGPAGQAGRRTERTQIGTVKTLAEGSVPRVITATDAEGRRITLDLRDGPVLVAAWWCPHCAALLARSDLPGLPRVVTVWPQSGQTMKQILQAEESMMKADGWRGDWAHGLFAAETVPGVDTVPTLLYWSGGKVEELKGETIPATDVARVLGGKAAFTKTAAGR